LGILESGSKRKSFILGGKRLVGFASKHGPLVPTIRSTRQLTNETSFSVDIPKPHALEFVFVRECHLKSPSRLDETNIAPDSGFVKSFFNLIDLDGG
jgi:hypothetical protein